VLSVSVVGIIPPATSAAGARETAERLRNAVMQQGIPHSRNSSLLVTVSVGCATMMPKEGTHITDIVAAADAALYAAKKGGRNRVEVAT
jgi:diguanylate cyclase (GGDEF)-like protein